MTALSVAHNDFVDLESVPRHRHFSKEPRIELTRSAVPFDSVMIVGLDIEHYDFATFRSVDTDIPPAFFDAYIGELLFPDDPLVLASRTTHDCITDVAAYAAHHPSDRLSYVLERFGLFNRTFFFLRRAESVFGAACFSRKTPFSDDEIGYLGMVAPALHTAIKRPLMTEFAAAKLRLNDGELACLQMASRGMTSDEMAERSSFQLDTDNTYIKTAARKLGASNRVQVVAEALRRGLID